MTTVEEDACEAVCQEMGMTDDDLERFDDRALVWDFCERFIATLQSAGFRIQYRGDAAP